MKDGGTFDARDYLAEVLPEFGPQHLLLNHVGFPPRSIFETFTAIIHANVLLNGTTRCKSPITNTIVFLHNTG